MVTTRRNSYNINNHNSSTTCSDVIIQDLFSYFHSSQELKLLELKSLYYLLAHLSLDPASYRRTRTNSSFSDLKIGLHGISVSFAALCSLSEILFRVLNEMFNEFLSTLHNASASFSEQDSLHSDTCATAAQHLNLLLRCCMVMLKLLVLDQNRLMKNGLVLHAILAKLCSLHMNQGNEQNTIHYEKVSQEYKCDGSHFRLSKEDFVASLQFIQPIDHRRNSFSTMLEVFLDELSPHVQLRELFKLFDSCSTGNNLFKSHPDEGDFGSLSELVCTHFCISFSGVQTFESIEDKLFGFQRNKSRVLELGPLSALNLLLNPLMFTAPKYLQAHLVCLVSESLASVMDLQNDKLLDCYLAAFEKSVNLYIKHMSPSDGDSVRKFSAYKGNSQPSFESYLRPVTRKQLNHLISKLDDSFQLQLKDRCLRSKNDLTTFSVAHITDSKEFLNTSFKDDIESVTISIILNALPDEVVDNALHTGWDTKPGSIYLLASIMKLMSCSLLQAALCLMNSGDLKRTRTLKDLSTCKEHNLLMEVTSQFKKCDMSLPIQKSLLATMDAFPKKHKESKLMLIHFSGLLSLCYKSGIDFLFKGCISVIIAVMNLFCFEEGNLNALGLPDGSELFSSNLPEENGQVAMVSKRSSLVIASKYKKIRTYLSCPLEASGYTGTENGHSETSGDLLISNSPPCVVDMEEETVEASNGSFFLKCVLGNSAKVPDFDDLADFIECKKDKDYSGWLKNRQRYRQKKCDKMAVVKWKKKKSTWRCMKANTA